MLKLFRKIFSEKLLLLAKRLKGFFKALFKKKEEKDGSACIAEAACEEPDEEEPLSEDITSEEEPENEAEETAEEMPEKEAGETDKEAAEVQVGETGEEVDETETGESDGETAEIEEEEAFAEAADINEVDTPEETDEKAAAAEAETAAEEEAVKPTADEVCEEISEQEPENEAYEEPEETAGPKPEDNREAEPVKASEKASRPLAISGSVTEKSVFRESISENFEENIISEENKEKKKGSENMKLSQGEAAVEAILFAAGNPVEIDSIAKVIGEDKATAESLAESLIMKYNTEKRGISVIKINDSYQMCTNRQFYNYIDRLFKQPKRKNMSQAILEVLAIIAYKQPVTKTEIEEIRGINSDRMVNKLVEYNLVCEMGRKKVPGRPILFGTTDEFLRTFGYSSAEAMPELKTPDVNAFDEAAREVSERLEKAGKAKQQ